MTPQQQEHAATLKQAIAASTRALARRRGLHVTFGTPAVASDITLPPLTSALPSDQLGALRGEADYAALGLRFHDKALHNALRPKHSANNGLFDMLESIRVESLGSQHMEGVHQNLAQRFEKLCMQRGTHAQSLSYAARIELFARHTIQRLPIPAWLTGVLDKPGDAMIHALPLLEAMRTQLGVQKAYALLAHQLIEQLANSTPSVESGQERGENPDFIPTDNQQEKAEKQEMPIASAGGEANMTTLARHAQTQTAGADAAPEQAEESERSESSYPSNSLGEKLVHLPYHSYVSRFDETVLASSLSSPAELEHLRHQLDQKMTQFQTLTSRLSNRLQRLLMARQARHWVFDEDDGMLDSRKLARIIIHPDEERIYKREKESDFRDTVVSLLIDNSGSMRGRPITMAAICADLISRTLERCGVKVEILGFTTKEWKGGQAHKQWIRDGKPPHPGRLNDLRHIIYKSADVSWRKARKSLGLMLKDGILKENIDGEAILWACDRLLKRPEQRRILMVISDGAPVDDSTLSVNNGNYLDKHLRDVIARVEQQMPVELLAIGIGHDVTRYYKRAVTIADIDKLGETMTEQLLELFGKPKY